MPFASNMESHVSKPLTSVIVPPVGSRREDSLMHASRIDESNAYPYRWEIEGPDVNAEPTSR